MKYTEEQLKALACAIAVLEGTAGGYGPTEKMNAKMELMKMFQDGAAHLGEDRSRA